MYISSEFQRSKELAHEVVDLYRGPDSYNITDIATWDNISNLVTAEYYTIGIAGGS